MTELHEHRFQRVMHLDRCCSYENHLRCECGATALVCTERDPKDSFFEVWAEPDPDKACANCEELRGGRKPTHRVAIWAADGTVERDEVTELDDED